VQLQRRLDPTCIPVPGTHRSPRESDHLVIPHLDIAP
jgi:hypothetical protein